MYSFRENIQREEYVPTQSSYGGQQRIPSASSANSAYSSGSGYTDNSSVEGGETIRVVVRCRPLAEHEALRGDERVVQVENDDTVKIKSDLGLKSGNGLENVKNYRFNRAVGEECDQARFFDLCGVQPLIDSALNGYAATVIAYGQTGSGKTYSMSGVEERIVSSDWKGRDSADGIIPRSMAYIFDKINSRNKANQNSGDNQCTNYTVRASYCEIYNEQVYDLLNYSGKNLEVRWNVKMGFFVRDLFVVECESLEDVMAVVSEGHRNRRTGSHEMNKDSSRSHSCLTIHVESSQSEDGHTCSQFGKIVFVDLAGSERLKDSKSEGVTLTETGAINKSLFTLSNVICALSEKSMSKRKLSTFIPYRNSKLTKLLMDSLGGASKTLMIACCSPSAQYEEETSNTLKYATRVACIKNKPVVQVDEREHYIIRLRQALKFVKAENIFLRNRLKDAGIDINDVHNTPPTGPRSYNINRRSFKKFSENDSAQTAKLPDLSTSIHSEPKPPMQVVPNYYPNQYYPDNSRVSPRSGHGLRMKVAVNSAQNNSFSIANNSDIQPQIEQQQERNQQLEALLHQCQLEVERLKKENSSLIQTSKAVESKYEVAVFENERLSAKLEHLEEIFVHNGDSKWHQGHPGSPGPKKDFKSNFNIKRINGSASDEPDYEQETENKTYVLDGEEERYIY